MLVKNLKTPISFLQQYIQQVESLSLSKFCEEAGFLRVVEVGQHFVTKDIGDFRQFHSVACREHTLPRDEPNMRIGTCIGSHDHQYFQYGIEIRI